MQVFQEIISLNPDFFEKLVNDILDHAYSKRWFELGSCIVDLFSSDAIVGERLNIYNNFVKNYITHLNQLHLTKSIILAARDLTSPLKCLEFLKENKKLITKRQFSVIIDLQMVNLMSQNGLFEEAIQLLAEAGDDISETSPISVRIKYCRTRCELDKARSDYNSLYIDYFYYLSTSSKSEGLLIAYDMCIAALLATDVISFQELASHPILNSLKATDNEWIRNLIILIDTGEPSILKTFEKEYKQKILSNRFLAPYIQMIEDKIVMSIFYTLVFKKPFKNRKIQFSEISEACQIPIEKVEYLVLKAFAHDIIKGYIDEIDQIVVVIWCKPRALSIDRLKHLKNEIDNWREVVNRIRTKGLKNADQI